MAPCMANALDCSKCRRGKTIIHSQASRLDTIRLLQQLVDVRSPTTLACTPRPPRSSDGWACISGSCLGCAAVIQAGAAGFTLGTAALDGAFPARSTHLTDQLAFIVEQARPW
jgi:hypothetical protein